MIADACFKAAIGLIPELMMHPEEKQRNPENFLISYTRNFLSTLLVVPDSPDRGVLNLVLMLLKTLKGLEWDPKNSSLANLYLDVLNMLSAMAQENYSYHVDKGMYNIIMEKFIFMGFYFLKPF